MATRKAAQAGKGTVTGGRRGAARSRSTAGGKQNTARTRGAAGRVFPGADQLTPSRAQYFSWINNTNEGPTEAQTQVNLDFFAWLHRTYGMVLDIYAFDAGAIDGAKCYGSTDSERFRRAFPHGFGPVAEQARAIGCRLGVWGGPDGFGHSPADARRRIEMMVALCRDHHFALFKMDSVCGPLRPDKQDHFVELMTRCRRYAPDLILLNHRLDLGKGLPHATTFLWGGAETYIDVHMANEQAATHNRVCALARGLPPGLQRLTEDSGVCLSSCLDSWDDDLVLQAFNRCLILAPEIYGNPWLLRDDEYPRLARIYNLHRRYRDILVRGRELPAERFGPHAVARGDGTTQLLTLRNLTWKPVTYRVPLDGRVGLSARGPIEVRRLHPREAVLGTFPRGEEVAVRVEPFRAALVVLAPAGTHPEVAVTGCEYEVVRDVPGQPVTVRLLGVPGTRCTVQVRSPQAVRSATLDGAAVDADSFTVTFAGRRPRRQHHRRLGVLARCPVPADAQALYEATCFAADNNALEVRELERSGPTTVPEVQRARDAFFNQPLFRRRFVWDRFLFDDDAETGFAVSRRWGRSAGGAAFRLDFGRPIRIDHLRLEVGGDYALQPLKSEEGVIASVSADLKTWRRVYLYARDHVEGPLPDDQPIRYVVLDRGPDLVRHVRGSLRGRELDRTGWRASNLFENYPRTPAVAAWSHRFTLDEAAPGSYLCIAVHGRHGTEKAFAALRVGDGYAGAPRRAPSYPSNAWECPVRAVEANYTYFIPVTEALLGRSLEAVVLLLRGGQERLRPEVWITAESPPRVARELVLER